MFGFGQKKPLNVVQKDIQPNKSESESESESENESSDGSLPSSSEESVESSSDSDVEKVFTVKVGKKTEEKINAEVKKIGDGKNETKVGVNNQTTNNKPNQETRATPVKKDEPIVESMKNDKISSEENSMSESESEGEKDKAEFRKEKRRNIKIGNEDNSNVSSEENSVSEEEEEEDGKKEGAKEVSEGSESEKEVKKDVSSSSSEYERKEDRKPQRRRKYQSSDSSDNETKIPKTPAREKKLGLALAALKEKVQKPSTTTTPSDSQASYTTSSENISTPKPTPKGKGKVVSSHSDSDNDSGEITSESDPGKKSRTSIPSISYVNTLTPTTITGVLTSQVMESLLYKRGKILGAVTRRWYVLENGNFTYYKKKGDPKPLKQIALRDIREVRESKIQDVHLPNAFEMNICGKVHTFGVSDKISKDKWISAFQALKKT